jgi:hypothetical protein
MASQQKSEKRVCSNSHECYFKEPKVRLIKKRAKGTTDKKE